MATYLVLASNIPHGEADVLVLDSLDVEACNQGERVRGSQRPEGSNRLVFTVFQPKVGPGFGQTHTKEGGEMNPA